MYRFTFPEPLSTTLIIAEQRRAFDPLPKGFELGVSELERVSLLMEWRARNAAPKEE